MRSSIILLGGLFAIFTLNYNLNAQVTFSPAATYSAGPWPDTILTADVNGDGKVDLICHNIDYVELSVLMNDGTGSFVIGSTLFGIDGVKLATAADINGDNKVDLICQSYYDNTKTFTMTNDGSGGFAVSTSLTLQYPGYLLGTADLNGDNRMDLICVAPSGLLMFTNDGNGGFSTNIPYASSIAFYPLGTPGMIVSADVQNIGKMDLIFADAYAKTISVLTNNGAGGFALSSTCSTGGGAYTIALGDVNGDGKTDLISANSDDNTLSVFTNNGSGGFVSNASYTLGPYPYTVAVVDINGDGSLDIICANTATNTLSVLTNNGSGGFALACTPKVGNGPSSVVAADVNGDGKLDLICSIGNSNQVTVLINTSVFPPPTTIPSLTVNQKGNNVHVSWPRASAGWSLQQSSSLTNAVWSPSGYNGYGIVDDGINKSLTLPPAKGNMFFRLLHS